MRSVSRFMQFRDSSGTLGAPVQNAVRMGIVGAVMTLTGAVFSGPLAVGIVSVTHPQPPWRDVETFARAAHPIQLLPYIAGALLVAGLVVLLTALIHGRGVSPQSTAALVCVSMFATFVFMNYAIQTTVVPSLLKGDVEANASLLTVLTMANPASLAWSLEMWGWGFLGVATWLMAGSFQGGRLETVTRYAYVINGPVSVAGVAWTVIAPGWVSTRTGLLLYGAWNVLLIILAAGALATLRRRARVGVPLTRR